MATQWISSSKNIQSPWHVHDPGIELRQRPRHRQRQSRFHRVLWESQLECCPLSAGSPTRNTVSDRAKHTSAVTGYTRYSNTFLTVYKNITRTFIDWLNNSKRTLRYSICQWLRHFALLCVCPHLHHAALWYGSDSSQIAAHLLQAVRHILVKENGEIGPFWLGLAGVNPACHITESMNKDSTA